MKRSVFLTLLFFIASACFSQSISVSSFKLLDTDLTANTAGTMEKDQNGEVAALIKVVTTQTGFSFDGGALGIVKTLQKPSEIWVYVPRGLKKITISHPQLGLLRDYYIPISVESGRTYEMRLTTGMVQTIVSEDAGGQYLVMSIVPIDATVFIDDSEVEVNNGVVSKLLPYGKHSYRVSAPLYQTDAGMVEIGKSKRELEIKLLPDYGIVSVKTKPEAGALIYLDNEPEPIGTSPLLSRKLSKGYHLFRAKLNGYSSKSVNYSVVGDGSVQDLSISMDQIFGVLKVTIPEGCTLFVNNEEKQISNWNGRLSEGIYVVEARRKGYRSKSMNINITKGETKNIVLPNPTPIVGSLDIGSTPIKASVIIDGDKKGVTPDIIKNVLVGSHTLVLKKDGYEDVVEEITIEEGKINRLSFKLNQQTVSHKTNVNNVVLSESPISFTTNAAERAAYWNSICQTQWKKFSDIQNVQLENQVKKIDAPYDTIGMHHAAVAALEAALKCDEFDMQPNKKGKVNLKYRQANAKKFQQGRLNAINAGQYDFNLKDYQQAFKDFSLYVDSHNAPLFEGIDLKDQYYHEIAYFASLAAYNAKDWPNVVKYAKIASENPEKAKDATEILVFAKKETIKTHADTLEYIEMLKDANNKFPDDQRYSAWIGDYYLQSASNDELLKWAEEEIQKDPNNKFAYTYKGEALRLSQKWDEAVECYKKAAELDPSYVVAPYQAGLCLNSKAIELKDKLADKKTGMLTKENADKIRAVLSESKEFLEKVREADPDRAQVNWAYALYQVYYSLGDEKAKELESIVGGN